MVLNRDDALRTAGRAERGDRTALGRILRALVKGETYTTYAGNPNNRLTPDGIGAECYDTTNQRWFKSRGASNSSWGLISPAIAIGTIAGNASTISTTIGFVPDFVEIINDTANATAFRAFWTKDMTTKTALKIDASSLGTVTSAGGISQVTTAGSEGFKIGPSLSTNGVTLKYVAMARQ